MTYTEDNRLTVVSLANRYNWLSDYYKERAESILSGEFCYLPNVDEKIRLTSRMIDDIIKTLTAQIPLDDNVKELNKFGGLNKV
jgi:hypothetical protein